MSAPSDVADLRAALDHAIAEGPDSCIDRVVVLDETTSTQDEARRRCEGRPGLLVVASRQTGGRGRLGRRWIDDQPLGLAATFVLPAPTNPGLLSLQAGLAACLLCEAALDGRTLGVRWPNDVVTREPHERKLAGVLVEQADGLAFLGIGINVLHALADFDPALAGRAASLRLMGSTWDRPHAAAFLISVLSRCLSLEGPDLLRAWHPRDTLARSRRTFEHAGQRYTGQVLGIDPLSHIELMDEAKGLTRLPALTTSMIHDP